MQKWGTLNAMIDVEKEEQAVPRALLVGEPGNNLQELKGLVLTLGMDVIQRLTLSRMEVHPAYGIGKGKAQEIAELAKQIEADCIILTSTLNHASSETGKNSQESPALTARK